MTPDAKLDPYIALLRARAEAKQPTARASDDIEYTTAVAKNDLALVLNAENGAALIRLGRKWDRRVGHATFIDAQRIPPYNSASA